MELEYASEELRNNKEVVLEAVKKNGSALEYASERLQADKDVVLAAVKQYGDSIVYANWDSDVLYDREIILAAVKQRTKLGKAWTEFKATPLP